MGLTNALVRSRAGFLVLALALGAGWAMPGDRATAQPAVYTASGIVVDLTGDIATLRDQAMLQGQRQALQQILNEIAPAEDVARLTLPGDNEISGWVQDFTIDEEKSSADRYIGHFTFRFQAEPIRSLLADNGISFAQSQARTLLIVPVMTDDAGTSVLWGPANQWLAAWAASPSQSALLRVMVPSGDPGDVMTLSAVEALAGDRQKLSALAARHGAGEVAVAEAALLPIGPDGMRALSIAVTRPGPDGMETLRDQVTGDALAQDELMRLGVERTVAMLQQSLKSSNLVDASVHGEIAVDVPVVDLKEWVSVKRQLAKVQGLRGARLVSLTRSLAQMELTHIGTGEQFQRALAQQGLALTFSGEGQGTLKLDPNAATALLGATAQPEETLPSDQPAVPDDAPIPADPTVAPQ